MQLALTYGYPTYNKPRQGVEKQRHHFMDKGLSSQSYGFFQWSCWMWELDVKKAECWRIDAFELWFWRRLLRVPWTARRSNQSVLKEINLEYSLEGLILKLKLLNFGQLTYWKRSWCWERLKEEWEVDDRGWDCWMTLCPSLSGHEFEQTPGNSEG